MPQKLWATPMNLRAALAATHAANNVTLPEGHVGYETDTRFFKVGDGVTPWSDLPYDDTVKLPRTVTSNYTMDVNDGAVIGIGAITITLPAANAVPSGHIYIVKNKGIDNIIVNATNGAVIDSEFSQPLLPGSAYALVSDGIEWMVI